MTAWDDPLVLALMRAKREKSTRTSDKHFPYPNTDARRAYMRKYMAERRLAQKEEREESRLASRAALRAAFKANAGFMEVVCKTGSGGFSV